jgi:hypothetical protein
MVLIFFVELKHALHKAQCPLANATSLRETWAEQIMKGDTGREKVPISCPTPMHWT